MQTFQLTMFEHAYEDGWIKMHPYTKCSDQHALDGEELSRCIYFSNPELRINANCSCNKASEYYLQKTPMDHTLHVLDNLGLRREKVGG